MNSYATIMLRPMHQRRQTGMGPSNVLGLLRILTGICRFRRATRCAFEAASMGWAVGNRFG